MMPYQDKNISIEERITDLISRMTLKEKILQTDQYSFDDFIERDKTGFVSAVCVDKLESILGDLSCGSIQTRRMSAEHSNLLQKYAVEKTRLGIPFLLSEEALHGVLRPDATSFPQQLGLAATFRPELGKRMGHAIAAEARSVGVHETYSPVMDLARDPRYGRTEETYGEDTFLGGEFARETVRGMQGNDLTAHDAIAAEPKHYVGYGNPVAGINCAPSTMGRHDVFSDCLPIFEEAFKEAGAMDAMCSYNSIDSVPVAMDHELLTDVLRGQYGMRGFVRTDMTAVSRLYGSHHIVPTEEEAVRLGLEAGADLELYDFKHEVWQGSIEHLVTSGRMSEKVLDTACRRVLRVKFLLGLFENPYVGDTTLAQRTLRNSEHLSLAREIAQNSIVLLKNSKGLLPLDRNIGTIAVIGPLADTPALGDYSDADGREGAVSILDGIRAAVSDHTNILYAKGCEVLDDIGGGGDTRDGGNDDRDGGNGDRGGENDDHGDGNDDRDSENDDHGGGNGDISGKSDEHGGDNNTRDDGNDDHGGGSVDTAKALEYARRADAVVVCLGDNEKTSGENFDRCDLNLPGKQLDFLKAVHETGTPVILVMQTGRPVSCVWEEEHIGAILEAWLPGEQGGNAIADVLFGAFNPGGRLPVTFPKTVGQVPCHYSRRPGGGDHYVEMSWAPLYPFGYGLSYTAFGYSGLTLDKERIKPGESVRATFTVTNTGSLRGSAVPQIYLRDRCSSVVKPMHTLAAFLRTELEPGESKTVTLTIGPKTMRTLGADYVWRVEPGDFEVQLCDNAEEIIERRGFTVE